MAFNTSGVYTRVDNSFSNPVVGTTISPTDADTYFDDIDAALNAYYGTSTSSVAIGLGSKSFTTQTGKLFGAGRFVVIRSDANAANYMFGQVTSYSSTTLTVNVLATGGSGTLADWTIYISGARGGAGPVAGIKQTYSTTTTDSDPGAGTFRLNSATIASVTEGYFDNADADGGTVSAIFDLWDDSTTTTKGTVRIEKQDDSSVYAVFTLTGSVVDGTGYRKLTLTHVASNGTFTNGDTFRIAFSRSGDKGSDGAGAGDVTAASNFGTDNVVVRSDGTSKGVQSSGVSIDDSNNVSIPGTIELGHASDTTISRTGSGAIAVEGVGVALNSTSLAHTAGTIELGHASDTTLARSAAGVVTVEGTPLLKAGKQTIFIPAAAMTARTTNGAASGTAEMSTNKNMFKTLDFDTTTQEFAQFEVAFPKSWDLGTVTFQPILSHASGSGNVVFGLAGVARSDDDAGDVAFGTAQTSDKTVGTANDIYIGPESSAITIAGSPAAGDTVQFQINRTVASDNLGVDARLHGIKLYYTTNAATDV